MESKYDRGAVFMEKVVETTKEEHCETAKALEIIIGKMW